MTAVEALEQIAVVGMDCRFPGAANADRFWSHLIAGHELIEFPGEALLRAAGVPADVLAQPDYVRAVATIPDADRFDPSLFGMTTREAELCDPQFRAFLETCHGALEQAGYDPFAMSGSVGVFGSVGFNGYLTHCLAPSPDLVGSWILATSLNQADYLATQVAYRLDLRGPAVTVLTACSGTLATIHLACQALRAGECDVALAGGAAVRVPLGHGYLWTAGGITSRDGHCRPFDAGAGGTVFGSGAGTVVLKRLDDAVAAGDDIRAVVLGSAMNNDGAEKVSFSAPSVSGQTAVVMEAMMLAGTAPAEIGYVEAHGTGTALGDPVEVAALAEAYARLGAPSSSDRRCVLSSVKSNIGHLDNASGIAGFIKAVLALEHEAIPGTANLRTVNPRLRLEHTPFRVDAEPTVWPRDPDVPRRAAVTSLGIGGTNVHVVLGEGPVPRYQPSDGRPRVVVWSAAGEQAERTARSALAEYFRTRGTHLFPDAVGTLQHGRTAHRARAAAVCASSAEAAAALSGAAGAPPVVTGEAVDGCRVAYLVPGHGSERARMAAGLYGRVRSFTVAMDECLDLFADRDVALYEWWTGGADPVAADDPVRTQSLLFAVGYALGASWTQWGVAPAAVLGHSLGEITAATLAGVFQLPDAVRLVVGRGAAMAAHPVTGGMLAVGADEETVRGMLAEPVHLAAANGAERVVVSGPDLALEKLHRRLRAAGVPVRRVPTSAAFHHPGWAAAADAWTEEFDCVTTAPARVPVYSAAHGGLVDDATLSSPEFWTGQLLRPVRFHEALGALLGAAPHALLEIGAGRTLTGLAGRHPLGGGAVTIPGLRAGDERDLADGIERDLADGDKRELADREEGDLLAAAARLWAAGCPLDWSEAGQLPPMVRVALPGYPYQRVRCWVDPPSVPPTSVTVDPAAEPAPSIFAPNGQDRSAEGAVTEIHWVRSDLPASPTSPLGPSGHALILGSADRDRATAALLAVQRAGFKPVPVPAEQDPRAVIEELAGRGVVPDLVVYAPAATPHAPGGAASTGAAERLDREYAALLAVCRMLLSPGPWPADPPELVLLTSGGADVSGAEALAPEAAALPPLVRTLRAEAPELACRAIDVDGQVSPWTLAAELTAFPREPFVALRGRRRWVPMERPLPLPEDGEAVLRDRGVYVITGGMGGLGLAVARGLAGTGLRPRIALLSRGGGTDRVSAVVDEVRALGAEVHRYACDVTDGAALRRVLDEVTDRFGPVNGLLHLAGLAGGRMIAFQEPAGAAAVLAPKTVGWDRLEQAFAGRPRLDFAVAFGSRAAAEGLVGGGDYAVANGYLDAVAGRSGLAGGRVLAIGWPVWTEVGMAARASVDIGALGRTVRELRGGRPSAEGGGATGDPALVWEGELSAATHWALDEHRAGRIPLLPGSAQLEMLLDAYRELRGLGRAPVVLRDAVFRAALLDKRPRVVRLSFRENADGHAAAFESRPTAGGDWTLHTTAEIGPHDQLHDQPAGRVDLDELCRRFAGAVDVARGRANSATLVLGPRWRNISASWTLPGERLLRIELPAAYRSDVSRHRLHPALLDTATAGVRTPERGSALPFLYRRLVVHDDLPDRFHAHIRLPENGRPDDIVGDVDLIADDGRVVVSVHGFAMRPVDDETLSLAPPDASDASDDAAKKAPAADGLAPAQGVELLLRLLAAGCTGGVLVRPFADGRPVPLPAAGGPDTGLDSATSSPVTAPRPTAPALAPEAGRPLPVPSEGSLDERLAALWTRVLGVAALDPDEDFFDAGGDSLGAIDLIAGVRGQFGLSLSVGVLLEARTFSGLLAVVRERAAA